MDSISSSAGDLSGLMKMGTESDPLLARIDDASMALCSFTRIGLGLDF